jgi:predicted Zn-ribbon and HTH transcriptional regulator
VPPIKLRHPYKGYRGYKQRLPDGRMYICAYLSEDDRTLISLARYRLSVKLGRKLKGNEEADHIDENKANDSYANLQLLSHAENVAKHIKLSGKTARPIFFKCKNCGNEFSRFKRGKKYIFCSRKCIGLYYPVATKIDSTHDTEIKKLAKKGLSSYKIHDLFVSKGINISRATIGRRMK